MYSPLSTAALLNASTDTVPLSPSYPTTVLIPRPFHLSKLHAGWLHTPITNGEPAFCVGVVVGVLGVTGTGGGTGVETEVLPIAVGTVDGSAALVTMSLRD